MASADTAETFSVNFPGDASGTINNDNGSGLRLAWPLVAGSDFQVTANQWAAGVDYATSNQQNLLDNTANNVLITGVQLEVGSVATEFEHRPIHAVRAACERYFVRYDSASASRAYAIGQTDSTTRADVVFYLPVEPRADPTLATNGTFAERSSATNPSLSIGARIGNAVSVVLTITGGTQGEAALLTDSGGSSHIDFDMEL